MSSRTFHARIDELYARIEMMDRGVNGNINHKFDERAFPLLERMAGGIDAHAAFSSYMNWEFYRREGGVSRRRKKAILHGIASGDG